MKIISLDKYITLCQVAKLNGHTVTDNKIMFGDTIIAEKKRIFSVIEGKHQEITIYLYHVK